MANKSPELPDNLADLPDEWQWVLLNQLIDESRGISYGVVQPGSEHPNGVPIIRVNNVKDGRLILDDVKRISPDIEKAYSRTRLRGGEVLLTLVGSIGECAVVPSEIRGWNLARAVGIIPVHPVVNSYWILYCLQYSEIQHYMMAWANTTVQVTLNLGDVARLPIPLPPEAERNRIVEIIKALDDKIEANRRQNATLEATARALFKSWFVDFDPVIAKAEGHQPVAMDADTAALFPDEFEDSALGMIPKGWEVKPFSEVIQINPSRRLSQGEIAPYLAMENMPTHSARTTDWIYREVGSGTRFMNGDVLLARITPCLENGKTAYVDFLEEGQIAWGQPNTLSFGVHRNYL